MDLKIEDILSSFQQQVDTFTDFLKIIPWSETWMMCLMTFHFLVCLPFVLLTKNYHNLQYIVFFTFLVLVYMSETINRYAAQHWKVFSSENYFDSNGLFISTVFSAPILMNCLVLIVLWLYTAAKMLVGIKKQQLLNSSEKPKETTTNGERKKGGRRRRRRQDEEEEEQQEEEEEQQDSKEGEEDGKEHVTEPENEETRKNK